MLENASKNVQKGTGTETGTGTGTDSGVKEGLPYTMYDAFRSRPDLRQLSDVSQIPIRLGKAD